MIKSIHEIKVGSRFRQDLGDVADLAASIGRFGLFNPITVTADGDLVAGGRRLAAVQSLGWSEVPVTVLPLTGDDLRRAEIDENEMRLDLTPTEKVTICDYLRAIEAEKARARQAAAGPKEGKGRKVTGGGNLPQAVGKARDIAARKVGWSGRTFEKAAKVVEAARSDPETFGPIAASMDRTGNVEAAVRKVETIQSKTRSVSAAARAACENIVIGDFREAAKAIPDESAALVFTDPPYDRESVSLYGDLGSMASRVLIPGGSLITYLGQYALPEVVSALTSHLKFYWPIGVIHDESNYRLRRYGIRVKLKLLLWFVKGGSRRDSGVFVDDVIYSPKEKDVHPWQQSSGECRTLIEALTVPGDLVVDPCCGGGTTAAVAKALGRRWWTCDTDPEAVSAASARVNNVDQ